MPTPTLKPIDHQNITLRLLARPAARDRLSTSLRSPTPTSCRCHRTRCVWRVTSYASSSLWPARLAGTGSRPGESASYPAVPLLESYYTASAGGDS